MSQPVIFGTSNDVKTQRQNLNLNDQVSILSGTDDPTSVAKSAPQGSLYLMVGGTGGRVFKKLDAGSSTNWVEVGAGVGGINYITNSSGDSGTTGYAAYADAAGSTPVDGTGGSPTVTITRTTSTPLRGSGSLLITKDAANRQGEGVSCAFTIDEADKNKNLSISFDYAVGGTFTTGDASDVRVYIYDVTNSTLIAPTTYSLLGATSNFVARFATTSSTSYRLIFHVATTSASAWTLKLDNIKVGPQDLVTGTAVSAWEAFSGVTTSGFGTISGASFLKRRVGDTLHVCGYFTCGTTAGTTAQINLPAEYPINTALITGQTIVGQYAVARPGAGTGTLASSNYFNPLIVQSSTSALFFANQYLNSGAFDTGAGNAVAPNSSLISVNFTVPISTWSKSVNLSNASTFRMAPILANGTRVTTTPAALGEYRSRYKSGASANTFTDVAPTTAITAADGLRLHAKDYTNAQTSGEIGMYDIFIGKNKSFRIEYYASTGKTGNALTDYAISSSTGALGVRHFYDPTTGVLTVNAATNDLSTNTSRLFGIQTDGTNLSNGYFDVIVSENVQTTDIDVGGEEIVLKGGNGHGSTNTNIRRFTNVESNTAGVHMTLAQSAANGDSVTINTTGIYSITYHDHDTATSQRTGVSRNSNQLTTTIDSITDSHILFQHTSGPANEAAGGSVTLKLNAGDVIRAHTNGGPNGTSTKRIVFRITRIQ